MSRLRTGHGPDDWKDEGPGFARTQGYGGTLVVSESKPTMSPAERERARLRYWSDVERTRALARARWAATHDPVPRCEAPMPLAKDICSRTLNHKGYHATRAALDRDNRTHQEWRDRRSMAA